VLGGVARGWGGHARNTENGKKSTVVTCHNVLLRSGGTKRIESQVVPCASPQHGEGCATDALCTHGRVAIKKGRELPYADLLALGSFGGNGLSSTSPLAEVAPNATCTLRPPNAMPLSGMHTSGRGCADKAGFRRCRRR
jgi:hypothetical protein